VPPGFASPSFHFGDLAFVQQPNAAESAHVEVAQAQHPLLPARARQPQRLPAATHQAAGAALAGISAFASISLKLAVLCPRQLVVAVNGANLALQQVECPTPGAEKRFSLRALDHTQQEI